MFKNMKIGAKILLGFGVVVLFILAITVTITYTNSMSNEHLNTIEHLSTFQLSANTFLDEFSSARINAKTLIQASNEDEYNKTVTHYNNAKNQVDIMSSLTKENPEISRYSAILEKTSVNLSQWYELINQVNESSAKLDELKATFIKTGGGITEKTNILHALQFEDMRSEIAADSDAATLNRRTDRLEHGMDIVVRIGNLRRSFIRIIDLFETERTPDTLAEANDILESCKLYAEESRQQKNRDAGQAIADVLVTYIDLVDTYTNEKNYQESIANNTSTIGDAISSDLLNMVSQIDSEMTNEINIASVMGQTAQIVSIIMSAIALVAAVLMGYLIMRSITRPVAMMVTLAENLAEGDLNMGNISYQSKDEIGVLFTCMKKVVDVLNGLVSDMGKMADDHDRGFIDTMVDEERFSGAYGDLAIKTNNLVRSYIKHIKDTVDFLGKMGEGDFNAKFKQLPGQKAELNNSIETLRANIKSVTGEINELIAAAYNGDLSKRADVERYTGDWAALMQSLNKLVYTISVPIQEAIKVLNQLSVGNLGVSVTGSYKGEFDVMKSALNHTLQMLSSYISEISSVLGNMSNQDLTVTITREYEGNFSEIKKAINNISDVFNQLLQEINSAAEQVASGSRQISESSMSLAQGTSEQSSAVEEMIAMVEDVSNQTQNNAKSAEHASGLANEAKKAAEKGNEEMHAMLKAMDNINESSANISKIIKVIDDIAFQTNLLALNAAVEAARAGEHGKGFAVVAEEVRNLAGRSQNAARETSELIESSIKKVSDGSDIANKTAKALEHIVSEINEIFGIISEVAQVSNRQTDSIGQINVGISQISSVTQNNSATSEEQASAAEELSSQAELFKAMVDKFKL